MEKTREPGNLRASHSGQRATHSGQRASQSDQKVTGRCEMLSGPQAFSIYARYTKCACIYKSHNFLRVNKVRVTSQVLCFLSVLGYPDQKGVLI